jgi:hypothetical protein
MGDSHNSFGHSRTAAANRSRARSKLWKRLSTQMDATRWTVTQRRFPTGGGGRSLPRAQGPGETQLVAVRVEDVEVALTPRGVGR